MIYKVLILHFVIYKIKIFGYFAKSTFQEALKVECNYKQNTIVSSLAIVVKCMIFFVFFQS